MERIYICAVDCKREEEFAALLPPSFLKSAQKYRRSGDRAAALENTWLYAVTAS